MFAIVGLYDVAPRTGTNFCSPPENGAAPNVASRESKMRPGPAGCRRAPRTPYELDEIQPKMSMMTSADPADVPVNTRSVNCPSHPGRSSAVLGTVSCGLKL